MAVSQKLFACGVHPRLQMGWAHWLPGHGFLFTTAAYAWMAVSVADIFADVVARWLRLDGGWAGDFAGK
jgi:hypothetical protein